MDDDDLRSLTEEANALKCLGCGEMFYDVAHYDCRCTDLSDEESVGLASVAIEMNP